MLQVVSEVNAVDSPDNRHRAKTAPPVQRSAALVLEQVARIGMAVIVTSFAVIGIERRGMDGAGCEMEDRVAMTIRAVGGHLLFRCGRSNLEHDVPDPGCCIEPGNLVGYGHMVNIDAVGARRET